MFRSRCPFDTTRILFTMVNSNVTTRDAIECMGGSVICHDRGNIRGLGFFCYSTNALSISMISCLRKLRCWSSWSSNRIERISKRYRASYRANEDWSYDGTNNFCSWFTSSNGYWSRIRGCTRRAFWRHLCASFRFAFFRGFTSRSTSLFSSGPTSSMSGGNDRGIFSGLSSPIRRSIRRLFCIGF